MTVSEYITALQSLPGDLQVIVTAGTLDKHTLFKPAGYPHTMRIAVRQTAVYESQLQDDPQQKGCLQFDCVRLA